MNEVSTSSKGRIFPESKLAHEILDGLEGLEIGPAAHNPFGLKTRNVGLAAEQDPEDFEFFKQAQLEMCGGFAQIDIAADAAALPLSDNSTDFILHSHVWEHLPNPLAALDEWARVVRPGGFIFAIVPKRDAAAADQNRPVTLLDELLYRYNHRTETMASYSAILGNSRGHHTIFSAGLLREICNWFNDSHFRVGLTEIAYQETDDKVGNGHTIVWQVNKPGLAVGFARSCLARLRLRSRASAK